MIKYIDNPVNENFFINERKKGRGAIVYGNHTCVEVATFLEEVAPVSASRDKLMGMFFAGCLKQVDSADDIGDDEE